MLLALFALFSVATAQTVADCTTFCTDYMATCMPLAAMNDVYTDMTACQNECMEYPMDANCPDGVDATMCASGNSWGCRRYHLNVAMNTAADPTNPMTHCPHTTPLSSPTADITAATALSGTVCKTTVTGAAQNGLVADFCNTVTNSGACGAYMGGLTMERCTTTYQHVMQTMDVSLYPDGTQRKFPLVATGATGSGLPCRRYHAQVARDDDVAHCPHALFGAGGCGTTCETYCMLLLAICPSMHTATCEADCATVPVPTDWVPNTGKDIACRLYHLSVSSQSAADATAHCPHASIMSTPDTCGTSGAAHVTFSALLIAILAVATKFSS